MPQQRYPWYSTLTHVEAEDMEHKRTVVSEIVPLFGMDLCELCGNVCIPWGEGRKCTTCFTRLPLRADSLAPVLPLTADAVDPKPATTEP